MTLLTLVAIVLAMVSAVPVPNYSTNYSTMSINSLQQMQVVKNTIYVATNTTLALLDLSGNLRQAIKIPSGIRQMIVSSNQEWLFVTTPHNVSDIFSSQKISVYRHLQLVGEIPLKGECFITNVELNHLLLVTCGRWNNVTKTPITHFEYINYHGRVIEKFSTPHWIWSANVDGELVALTTFPTVGDSIVYFIILNATGVQSIYNSTTWHPYMSVAINGSAAYAASYNWTVFSMETGLPIGRLNPNKHSLVDEIIVVGDQLAYLESANYPEKPFIQFLDLNGNLLQKVVYSNPPTSFGLHSYLTVANDGSLIVSLGDQIAIWRA